METPFSLTFPASVMNVGMDEITFSNFSKHISKYATTQILKSADLTCVVKTYDGSFIYLEFSEGYLNKPLTIQLKAERNDLYFVYVSEGGYIVEYKRGKRILNVQPGQCYCHYCPVGTYNCILAHGAYNIIYFVIRAKWVRNNLLSSMAFSKFAYAQDNLSKINQLSPLCKITAEAEKLLQRLSNCYSDNPIKQEFVLLEITGQLLAIFEKQLRKKQDKRFYLNEELYGELARKVKKAILDDIKRGQHRNITEIVDQLHKEVKTVNRAFKLIYGNSPRQFMTDQRMLKAREILINSDLLIKEVASLTGYENYNAFTKEYTRYFHHSPNKERLGKN